MVSTIGSRGGEWLTYLLTFVLFLSLSPTMKVYWGDVTRSPRSLSASLHLTLGGSSVPWRRLCTWKFGCERGMRGVLELVGDATAMYSLPLLSIVGELLWVVLLGCRIIDRGKGGGVAKGSTRHGWDGVPQVELIGVRPLERDGPLSVACLSALLSMFGGG